MHPEPPNSGSIRTYRQENGRGRVVFNTFPMPFRAFGNALSVSIAFPLRFLFGGGQETFRAFPMRLLFVCFKMRVCEAAFPKRFRCVCFFCRFSPKVFNAFPTTFPGTFPMRFLFCLRKRIENVFCVSLFFAPVTRSVFNAFPMRFRPPRATSETQNYGNVSNAFPWSLFGWMLGLGNVS